MYFEAVSADVSPGLMDILSRMMHPDPKLRPTVDQILADHCIALALASYEHSCFKACGRLFSACKRALGTLVTVLRVYFHVSIVQGT